jgi:hypothetical protein
MGVLVGLVWYVVLVAVLDSSEQFKTAAALEKYARKILDLILKTFKTEL